MVMFMLVGGIGTLLGPLLGAVLVPWLTQSLQFLQDYRMIVFGPVLVLLIIFFPDGIVGSYLKRQARRAAAAPRHRAPKSGHTAAHGSARRQRPRPRKQEPTMLEIRNLTKQFGGLTAVNDVSITFEAGQINAIIGPNGAGKTTFFNLVAGTHRPDLRAASLFKGTDVTGLRADQVARLGIARTFQTTRLFDSATVLDNLIVGHRLRTRSGLCDVAVQHARG